MKLSEIFDSMDDVVEFCKRYENVLSGSEYKSLKKLLGLSEQEGDFLHVLNIGDIDKTIAYLVQTLNNKKYITISSCSGIRSEHKSWIEDHSGYISFYNDGQEVKINKIERFANEFKLNFDEEEVYLKPAITIRVEGTDEQKSDIWNKMFEYFSRK